MDADPKRETRVCRSVALTVHTAPLRGQPWLGGGHQTGGGGHQTEGVQNCAGCCGFWEKEQVRQGKLGMGFGIQLLKMDTLGQKTAHAEGVWENGSSRKITLVPSFRIPLHTGSSSQNRSCEIPSLHQEDRRHSPEISTKKHVNLIYLVIISSFTTPGLPWRLIRQCRRRGLNPGLGRASGEGNGNPLQYSCLENPMDRGTWQATVHGVGSQKVRHDWVSDTYYP